jgi:hypothetical protein
MGPIDYQSAMPQQDFLKNIQGGLQLGSNIQQANMQRQQQEQAQQQAQQYNADIQAAMASPTPQAFASLAMKYPQQREALKQGWDQLSEGDRRQEGDTMAQAYSALLSNSPEIAQKVIQQQIDARKNSGLDTSHYDNALEMVKTDPKKAAGSLGFILSHVNDPKAFATQFAAIGGEQRAQEQAPFALRQKTAEAGGAESDTAAKKAAVIGQTMGAMQGKSVKPEQIATAFKSLAARGVIGKDELPIYLADIPADAKELPAFLNTYKLSGMTPSEQMKYSTPSADAALSAQTQRRGQDIQQNQYNQENQPAPANETMAKQIAFYKAAPLGQFSLNKPWGQSTMDRVMQLNPEYDAAQYAPRASALKSYAAGGKESLGIDSINIGMNHIDTLRGLALAQKNGNIKQFNRLANAFATQTGNPAPTNLRMATDMVAPEIVKAVTGVGGTGEERAHFGESLTGKGSYSPDQVLGALNQVQELFSGRLKEKKRSYERSTKLNNFDEEFLSPTAKRLLNKEAPAKAHPDDIDQLLNKYGGKNG